MKHKLVFFIIYQALFVIWCFKMHGYFFEFTLADKIALVIISFAPASIILLKNPIPSYPGVMCLILTPIIAFPLIDWLRAFYTGSWLLLYVSLFLTGVSALIRSPYKWATILFPLSVWLIPYPMYANQHRYYDKLIESRQTRKGEIDLVRWKSDQWIYYNGSLLISSADGHMHSETLIHTVLPLFDQPEVLLIGGDHGLTANELNKYTSSYDHIPYDVEMAAQYHSNELINQPIASFLYERQKTYDIIILDLPDPENLDYQSYYQAPFYELVFNVLNQNGLMITNGGSPIAKGETNARIQSQLNKITHHLIELQAHIPTLGQRSWLVAGHRSFRLNQKTIPVSTLWLDKEAISMMMASGQSTDHF